MEIPTTPYEEWEPSHRHELIKQFRDYLRTAIDDAGFELTQVEDYWAWAQEEYICLCDMITD